MADIKNNLAIAKIKKVNETKKIKVENWSPYLLQKLHHCYSKNKFCDFTLKMTDGQIKVHSTVMHACSNYFIQTNLENSKTVTLPSELRKELVEPIVNFIYTGILTYKSHLHEDLIRASKILKIDILSKLIDTGESTSTNTPKKAPVESDFQITKHLVTLPIPSKPIISQPHPTVKSSTTPKTLTKSDPTTPRQNHTPVKQTPPLSINQRQDNASTTNNVEKDPLAISTPVKFEPPSPKPSTSQGNKMAMKKLPFWKKRTVVPGGEFSAPAQTEPSVDNADVTLIDDSQQEPDEDETDVKPSRFDLPDFPETPSFMFYTPNFENPISYESDLISKPNEKFLKRITTTSLTDTSLRKIKKIKLSNQEEEHDKEQEEEECGKGGSGIIRDHSDDEFLPSPPPNKTASTPKPILKTDKIMETPRKKSVRFSFKNTNSQEDQITTQTPKTVSQPDTSENISNTSESTSFTEVNMDEGDQENSETDPFISTALVPFEQEANDSFSAITSEMIIRNESDGKQVMGEINENHKKIIVEMLKKYPNLMKSNKCFKVKLVDAQNQIISYVMNNRTTKNKRGAKTKEDRKISNPLVVDETKSYSCKYCGPIEDVGKSNTYHGWREHMQQVHNEKFDARVCLYCGKKIFKKNLHLFHLYTVHKIKSPGVEFPHCNFCSYIGLTEMLLFKHCRAAHNKIIRYQCRTCSSLFKTSDELDKHIRGSEQCSLGNYTYTCHVCQKKFDRNVNLKAHLKMHAPDTESEFILPDSSYASECVKSENESINFVKTEEKYVTKKIAHNQQTSTKSVVHPAGYNTLELPGGVKIRDTHNGIRNDPNTNASNSQFGNPNMQTLHEHVPTSVFQPAVIAPPPAPQSHYSIIQTAPTPNQAIPIMVNETMVSTASMSQPSHVTVVQSDNAMLDPNNGGIIETNEAVLGTNECGQTVLILNNDQHYILEQHPDGRLILPDILANNCVISYTTAEDTSSQQQTHYSYPAQPQYEVINIEQAQMMVHPPYEQPAQMTMYAEPSSSTQQPRPHTLEASAPPQQEYQLVEPNQNMSSMQYTVASHGVSQPSEAPTDIHPITNEINSTPVVTQTIETQTPQFEQDNNNELSKIKNGGPTAVSEDIIQPKESEVEDDGGLEIVEHEEEGQNEETEGTEQGIADNQEEATTPTSKNPVQKTTKPANFIKPEKIKQLEDEWGENMEDDPGEGDEAEEGETVGPCRGDVQF